MSSGTGGEIQFIYQKEHNWDFFGHHRCYQSLGQDRTGLLGYSPTRAQCVPSAYPSTCLSMSTGCFCACLWGEWVPPAAPRASLQPHALPGPSGVQGTLRPGQEQPVGTISGDSQWGTPVTGPKHHPGHAHPVTTDIQIWGGFVPPFQALPESQPGLHISHNKAAFQYSQLYMRCARPAPAPSHLELSHHLPRGRVSSPSHHWTWSVSPCCRLPRG